MATLALAVAGAAVGSAVLPTGVAVLGATISGAAIGSQLGALAGSYVDQALFGASGETRTVEGPRLTSLHVTSSTEGAPIPRLYGRARLGGQLIWAAPIEEEAVRTSEPGRGGGGGKGGVGTASPGSDRIDYNYYASFAVAICAGEITGLGRVWADGAEIDLSRISSRLHKGSETQSADPLILARQGASGTPAYRGTAYIVFERLPLAEFGNRIPQLSFEVYRAVEPFGGQIRGVVMIPGSGEFVYATEPVNQIYGIDGTKPENVHTLQARSDWAASLDQLEADLPNVSRVSLVVSWFGTDLRAGLCQVRPGVEISVKSTEPHEWRAGGVDRSGAHLVSTRDDRPAYGGTPSDRSVVAAIRDLKARGKAVTLTPFVLMDVAVGSGLPDPYGRAEQPPYPWRGRITCHPAPGEPGTPDKTPAAGAEIAAFVGTAAPGDFAIAGDEVIYTGPAEWSYRRMVLHLAWLAKAAGGVEAFLLGTELRGLTWVRDGAASYPFVAALKALAADVKSILGPAVQVSYATDWTEYFGHQPQDGTGDVHFHLDPLWADPNIDAVGIDCYWPLADWRDGRTHADADAGWRSPYDLAYLRSNVRGGEGYDWYYATGEDRADQVRTPITDGAGKPWVFRYKDLTSWWREPHFDRPGGIEQPSPTAWLPQSKPVWLMEIGCPAVDKGANQPNVFVDPKSSENALPYFSSGSRDDLVQRRYLRALIEAFVPDAEGSVPGLNPISSVYGGPMVPADRIFVYCWDARPYPAFPRNLDVWGDGENWRLGHWLNGRLGAAPLAETVAAILEDHEFADHAAGGLSGVVPGFVIDRPMSARDALQPLSLAFFFDAIESGGRIAFRHRGTAPPVARLTDADLVETGAHDPLLVLTRGQETDLPASAKITYVGASSDYEPQVAEARRLTGASGRLSQAELPLVLEPEQAGAIAESWLHEAWAARERASFTLPPSGLALEPGDVVEIERHDRLVPYRVVEIADHGARAIEARSIDPDIYRAAPSALRPPTETAPVLLGTPLVLFLDLRSLPGARSDHDGYLAASQTPWPGPVAVYSSPETSGYRLRQLLSTQAQIGVTRSALPPGPVWRIDRATRLRVEIASGELTSVSPLQMLAGANLVAVRNAEGEWELMQFETADLVAPRTYELSGLLRGQAGSEAARAAEGSAIAAGASIVVLDAAVRPAGLTRDEVGLTYRWRYGVGGRDVTDPSYGEQLHEFRGRGLHPLSPVHVRGRRTSGDLHVGWIRRTRTGGDSWESPDVPLGEDTERYEADVIAADGAVLRTISVGEPALVYTAAEQESDFGTLPASIRLRIHQVSATAGRGAAADVEI